MANRTVKDASSVKGTNPQYLIEKIIRTRIYECKYWKEECFALTAELLVDKAMELRYIGGVYGGNIKPTPFICLVLKMLQIQPEKDIIIEFLRNDDFKYVRALGAVYMRIVGNSLDCYKYLEPLYLDYRKLRRQGRDGQYSLVHMDEFIDELLREERVSDVIMPRIQKRFVLEESAYLDAYVSGLDAEMDLDSEDDDDEQMADTRAEERAERRGERREDDKHRSRRDERRMDGSRRDDEREHKRRSSRERHRHDEREPRHDEREPRHDEREPRHDEREARRSRSKERAAPAHRAEKDRKRGRDDDKDRHYKDKDRKEKEYKEKDKDHKSSDKAERHHKTSSKKSRHDRTEHTSSKHTSSRHEKESLDVAEANALRAKLGLAPLRP